MLRAVWIIIVSTVASAAVGGLYDYFRPFLADVTRGGGAEAWFAPGNTQYLMPWLFAIAGLVSAIIAVAMSGTGKRAMQATPAKPAIAERSAAKHPASTDKATPEAVAGMPSFDFDKALAEVKTAPTLEMPAANAALSPSEQTEPPTGAIQ